MADAIGSTMFEKVIRDRQIEALRQLEKETKDKIKVYWEKNYPSMPEVIDVKSDKQLQIFAGELREIDNAIAQLRH